MKTRERKEQAKPAEFLTRLLPNAEVKADTESRQLTFSFSSTRPVERWTWFDDELPDGASNIFDEVLSHDAKHWRLERVDSGVCPYLKNHSRNAKLGRVLSVAFDGDRALATVKLRRSAEADQELLDIEDGVSGGVSFGYRVYKYRVIEPAEYEGEGWDRQLIKKAVLEGIDIELLEVSAEEIPADPSVGFGKSTIDLRTIQIEGDPAWEQPGVEGRRQQRQPKEKVVGKRRQTKTNVQTRELMLSDYLSAETPTLDDITTAFTDTLAAIDDAATNDDTVDTEALYQGAIADMAAELYTLYDVPTPETDTDPEGVVDPMAGEKTAKPTEPETERDREYKALQQKVALMERRETVTRKLTTLRQRAEALKSAGKLTPAEFKDKFGDVDAAIDLYTKADDSKLTSLEERLNDIEQYATPVAFGSKLDAEPLEVPETRSEHDAELEEYQASKKG